MVFKLVRTDTTESCKIQLPPGSHLFGRGKFLDCEDKRVSRNHGEIQVIDDLVTVKALHQNPCFIIKKNTAESHILKLGCSINLSHGDRFGLLPDCYWYELLHCPPLDVNKSPETNIQLEQNGSTDRTKDGFDDDENINFELNRTLANLERSQSPTFSEGSPSLIRPQGNDSPSLPEGNDTLPATQILNPPGAGQSESTEDYQAPPAPLTPSSKRSGSPQDLQVDVKKVKTEPEVKEDPDQPAQPGPSNDQGGSTTAAAGVAGQPPTTPAGRERCWYGAKCYRKNPQHKAEFSHPSDPDWGTGARVPCPQGAGCRRSDPRHWRDHDHPPGVQPPARPGMQIVHRNGHIFYINAHTVNFYDDHFQVEDSDGDSADYDYEF